LNIILFSQFFSTTKGGGEYLFKMIAKIMAQNGHNVWVITNNVKGEKYQELENLKIITVNPTIDYKGGLPPTFLDNIRYVINAFQVGKNIIKNQNIDIIHSNNFSPALSGSLLSYFTKTPHIITIFDIFSENGKDFWKKWIKQTNVSKINAMLVPWFEKILIKSKHDAIYTISNASKNDIIKMQTKKPIYNISPSIENENQLDGKVNPFQFIYIGRLIFYKNVEVILKSFKIVTKQFPDVKLIIAGDGPHKKSLQQLTNKLNINDNISFIGYVTSEQKKKILSESNALLFPSLIEGFGLVMLEAFQQNRPVITSDIPPMSDIIQNNQTGLVVDPHDENKWADSIIALIKNPEISNKMGKQGNQTLQAKYNQNIFYDKLIKMYNDIALN
jgi:glycosyltransferase involved in cell wall biosynthesis